MSAVTLRRRCAELQSITDLPDGSVILEMHTSGRQDVKRWIASHGPHAEVLEPVDLREEIAADAKKMTEIYGV